MFAGSPWRKSLNYYAPGKELFSDILEHHRFEDVATFYRSRVEWNNYSTIIHDRLSTYGIFDDIGHDFDFHPVTKSALIGHALTIAESEKDEHLNCALNLVLVLVAVRKNQYFHVNQDHIERLLALKSRVFTIFETKGAIAFVWNSILEYLSLDPGFKFEDHSLQYYNPM